MLLEDQHGHEPNSRSALPYALANFHSAVQDLEENWEVQGGDLSDSRDQNTVTSIMKAVAHRRFLDTCSLETQARISAVGFQTIPTRSTDSQICPAPSPGENTLYQCPMTLFELMCPFYHMYVAFIGYSSPPCQNSSDMGTLMFGLTVC